MKKEYKAPALEVVTIETAQMLAASQSLGISNTTTSSQWGRGSDGDWDDQEDW